MDVIYIVASCLALKHGRRYEVISVEKGWYRIMTELEEDYLFPPKLFEIIPDQYDPPLPERIEKPSEADKEALRQVLMKYRNIASAKGKDTSFWDEELRKL